MIGDNRHQGEIVSPEDKLQKMALSAAQAAAGSGGTISVEKLDNDHYTFGDPHQNYSFWKYDRNQWREICGIIEKDKQGVL